MKTFTQIDPEHIFEIPSGRSNADDAVVNVATAATLVTLAIMALIYWGIVLWRLPSKAGYTGAARWMWFLLLYFPLTGGLTLFAFVFVPWPVKKQLEKTEGQLEELRRLTDRSRPKPLGGVDDELDQMRKRMQG
jgi:hypothetical protein